MSATLGAVGHPRAGRSTSGAGDELLRALHDEHAHALWAFVVRLTGGDRARAEDVVQETLLRAWRSPHLVDGSGRSARGWLFTVARRIVIDEWRSPRTSREVVTDAVPDRGADTVDAAQQVVDHAVVTAALRTLSPEHRAVLLETYVRGSSVAEAAAALGIPPGTVKSRTHYALRALRLALEESGVLP